MAVKGDDIEDVGEDEEIDDDLDGGDGFEDDSIGDVNIEMDDDDLMDDGGFDDDDDDEPVVRTRAPKRRTTGKLVATIEGVPKIRLTNPETVKEVWDRLQARTSGIEAVPYALSTRLATGDVVAHAKFGLGHVIDVPAPTKAEVLFEDMVRKLVHNRI